MLIVFDLFSLLFWGLLGSALGVLLTLWSSGIPPGRGEGQTPSIQSHVLGFLTGCSTGLASPWGGVKEGGGV